MSNRPSLEKKITKLVKKDLKEYDEDTKFLITKLLMIVSLEKNKAVNNVANKLQAEIEKLYKTKEIRK
jgi:DNA-binding phage protein